MNNSYSERCTGGFIMCLCPYMEHEDTMSNELEDFYMCAECEKIMILPLNEVQGEKI